MMTSEIGAITGYPVRNQGLVNFPLAAKMHQWRIQFDKTSCEIVT